LLFHSEKSIMHWKQLPRMPRSRRSKRTRPAVDRLEDRRVLSTFTPTTFADGLGIGSLRDAVLSANADSSPGTDTIQLQAGAYSLTIMNRFSRTLDEVGPSSVPNAPESRGKTWTAGLAGGPGSSRVILLANSPEPPETGDFDPPGVP
jgi:hypothetical protein